MTTGKPYTETDDQMFFTKADGIKFLTEKLSATSKPDPSELGALMLMVLSLRSASKDDANAGSITTETALQASAIVGAHVLGMVPREERQSAADYITSLSLGYANHREDEGKPSLGEIVPPKETMQ